MFWTISLCLLLVGLLFFEAKDSQVGRWCLKPLTSATFVALACEFALHQEGPQRWVFWGLILGFLGDVLLIPKSKPIFLLGLVSFLLGHVAYIGAFVVYGTDILFCAASLAVLVPIGVKIFLWLKPHLPTNFLLPVLAYVVTICLMVAAAFGYISAPKGLMLFVAATLFWLSDICVARQRFMQPEFINKAIGLPLYYAAQLLFVWAHASSDATF